MPGQAMTPEELEVIEALRELLSALGRRAGIIEQLTVGLLRHLTAIEPAAAARIVDQALAALSIAEKDRERTPSPLEDESVLELLNAVRAAVAPPQPPPRAGG